QIYIGRWASFTSVATVLVDNFFANVTLGRDVSEDAVWQALETVQLARLASEMSDGIFTRLGEQGNNLSVGQKQLLAMARVLVATPQILILDEATANIDSGTEQAIQKALRAVRERTTHRNGALFVLNPMP
ncbi:ABC transporter family protein, partial [Candidatus Erwinia dacicola]